MSETTVTTKPRRRSGLSLIESERRARMDAGVTNSGDVVGSHIAGAKRAGEIIARVRAGCPIGNELEVHLLNEFSTADVTPESRAWVTGYLRHIQKCIEGRA